MLVKTWLIQMITHNVRTHSHNTPKHTSAKQIDFTPEKLLSLKGKRKRQIQKRNYIDSTKKPFSYIFIRFVRKSGFDLAWSYNYL